MTADWAPGDPTAKLKNAKTKPDPAVATVRVRSDAAWWDGFLTRVNALLREIGALPCTTP